MVWDWQYTFEILPRLARATIVTIEAATGGFALALVAGLVLAIARRVRFRPISWGVGLFVEFVRSTPLLIQLFFIYFGLPRLGLHPTPFLVGAITFGLHFSTYISEVYRAGLDAVPRGQWEAARALNLGAYDTLSRIVLPQAMAPVIPALGNYLILMIKDTPVLAAISVMELLETARELASESFRYLEPLTIVGLFFLLLSVLAGIGIRRVERWVNARVRP
jgi:polar amino acid transport system permease protein